MATQPTWGDANREVEESASAAEDFLTAALALMKEPHANSEGSTILEGLIEAQTCLNSAIKAYLDE